MKHRSSFIIFPKDTNHMYPVIFGGKFMAEMDLCAAMCVRKILQISPRTVDNAVTYKANFEFLKPCCVGDVVALEAEIVEVRHKSISVKVQGKRIMKHDSNPELVAIGNFVFISIGILSPSGNPFTLPYRDHGLTEEDVAKEITDW